MQRSFSIALILRPPFHYRPMKALLVVLLVAAAMVGATEVDTDRSSAEAATVSEAVQRMDSLNGELAEMMTAVSSSVENSDAEADEEADQESDSAEAEADAQIEAEEANASGEEDTEEEEETDESADEEAADEESDEELAEEAEEAVEEEAEEETDEENEEEVDEDETMVSVALQLPQCYCAPHPPLICSDMIRDDRWRLRRWTMRLKVISTLHSSKSVKSMKGLTNQKMRKPTKVFAVVYLRSIVPTVHVR